MRLISLLTLVILSACTINLQNVSSNGKSQDQLDTAQEASPDVKADVSLPIKAI